MSDNVIERGATSILILILPIAFTLVVLYTAWPLLLVLIALISLFRVWQQYQWQKWSAKVNPTFNVLVRENQGKVTPLDLSIKANLTAKQAKRFLEKKSEEYGAQRKIYQDQGTVYYFLTASALGTILDSSEPVWELEAGEFEAPHPPTESAAAVEETHTPSPTPSHTVTAVSTLIQTDLAKRLNVKDYTISRRKSNKDFPQWSQELDPDGIAWKYVSKDKTFVPQKPSNS
ncbi:MAG: hypothetical protein SAJ12_07825 [Jaaginema sp. PMC 1079.18]|nr:hypothetical protein [Jaaginema sp. PMC 1080.18]MEC4850907.1 hypothetical protein [Jaaginema sp. PMC 1079.18]MEC4865564.1 hypothetical protein [Jaaginema sp. PMC 1078.18]